MSLWAQTFPTFAGWLNWWLAGFRPNLRAARIPNGAVHFGVSPNGLVVFAGKKSKPAKRRFFKRAIKNGAALRVDASQWLTLHLTLPAGAIEEQRRMAAFDIGEETPFPAEATYFSVHTSDGKSIAHVVPQKSVANAFDELASQGVALGWLLNSETQDVLDLSQGGKRRSSRWWAIGGAALVSISSVVAFLFFVQSQELKAANERLERLRPAADQVRALDNRLSQILEDGEGANYSVGSKVTATLDRVTRLLPDSSYVTNFSMEGVSVRIGGKGRGIEEIVRSFEADPMFENVRIIGDMVLAADGLVSFELLLSLAEKDGA